jgi:hypothetical protein
MITIIVFFILGAALGLVGLRLLAHWEHRPLVKPHVGWLHRRH